MKTNLTLIFYLLFLPWLLVGQISQPHKPQANQFEPINTKGAQTPNSQITQNKLPDANPNSVYSNLSKSNSTLAPNSFIPPKQISSINYIHELVKSTGSTKSDYTKLPQLTSNKVLFDQAFNEISKMLDGTQKLDLRRAIFLTENAYLNGTLNEEFFNKELTSASNLIRNKIIQEGFDTNDNLTVNYFIHKYISDTIVFDEQGKKQTSYPKFYDFQDPFGIEDPTKMFVSKLIREGSGQCKSLPLLFLLLAEALDSGAYLSFSPSHSFIKCVGRNNEMYNVELTNGMLTNDAWLVGSGYIKAEAVRSGIYLDTMNKKQVIANCLVDLANYYSWKFGKPNIQMGHDEFVLQCVDLALEYHKTNINAILLKSDNLTVLLNYLAHKKGYTTEDQLINDPITYEVFQKRNILYAITDGLGYEYFGEADYVKWLGAFSKDENTSEYEQFSNKMKEK